MEEFMTVEWMLKEFVRIWPEGEGGTLYKLIKAKDEYKKDNCKFELLFKQAVLKYDYDIESFKLWCCEPTPHDILLNFLTNVAKAIGQCFMGERKKLWDAICPDLYTLDLLYKPILEIETAVELADVPKDTNVEKRLEHEEFKF